LTGEGNNSANKTAALGALPGGMVQVWN